jgi:ACR3 family arsenite efflux pump ArsB
MIKTIVMMIATMMKVKKTHLKNFSSFRKEMTNSVTQNKSVPFNLVMVLHQMLEEGLL